MKPARLSNVCRPKKNLPSQLKQYSAIFFDVDISNILFINLSFDVIPSLDI